MRLVVQRRVEEPDEPMGLVVGRGRREAENELLRLVN